MFSDTDYDAPMKTFVYGYDCDMYVIVTSLVINYIKPKKAHAHPFGCTNRTYKPAVV
jgi:hypothetical protein